MKTIRKFLLLVVVAVALLSVSYTQYNVGEFSFKYKDSLEISTTSNILLVGLIIILFVVSILNDFRKFVIKLFKNNDDQHAIVDIILLKSVEDIRDVKVHEQYKIIRDAAICSLIERESSHGCTVPNYSTGHPALFVHQSRINILHCIDNKNINEATSIAQNIIDKYCAHINVIWSEIARLSKLGKLNLNPRKFKYNLSLRQIEEYETNIALSSNDISKIEKANRNHPGNFEITKKLVEHQNSDKKTLDILKRCFENRPDRRLAHVLLQTSIKDRFKEISRCVPDSNIEKLWFNCIAETELNHISDSLKTLQQIIQLQSCNISEVAKFYILNIKIFGKNLELLQSLQNKMLVNLSFT